MNERSLVGDHVFFVSQVGSKGSPERSRADEVHDAIVEPVAKKFGMTVQRADRDPTPGQVTTQIIRALIDARIVVADLTGRNPNVYYELGVAHAFQKRVAILVDTPRSLSFDTRNEKVIAIGDTGSVVGVNQARDAEARLTEVFTVVLAEDYAVENLLTSVATARSLDALAPGNPVVSELAAMREQLDELHVFLRAVRRRWDEPSPGRADYRAMRAFIEKQAKLGTFTGDQVAEMISRTTSNVFDEWVSEMLALIPDSRRPGGYDDEEPF